MNCPQNISNEYFSIFSDYAKIIIPALITFLVTKYTINRPRQYEIRKKQFDLVYLPLYLLNKQFLTDNQNIDTLKLFIRKTEKIIYKNYPFVYPKTEKLFIKFKQQVINNENFLFSKNNLIYQLESDYEKLKRELGYPGNSFADHLKRLNKMDKLLFTANLFFVTYGIYSIATSFLHFLSMDIFNFLIRLFITLVCFSMVYIIRSGSH